MQAQAFSVVPYKTWLLLSAGPALFLVAIVACALFLSLRGVPAAHISERVAALAPHILLAVLLCLALLMTRYVPQVKAAWVLPEASKALADIAVGLLAGALLAIGYLYGLAPWLETLQRTVGDYVPAGSVLPTVSSSIGLFFVANVLLAPLVEETLYRGVAVPMLSTHLGVVWAVGLTCVAFGLLHWAGGFWYMLLTALAGGVFAGLYLWRGGILAPFAAHLALNLIEYVYAWRTNDHA